MTRHPCLETPCLVISFHLEHRSASGSVWWIPSASNCGCLLKAVGSDFSFFGHGTHHGEEKSELGVEVDAVPVGEDELLLALLLGGQHDGDLLGGDGQNRQVDSVELVKTAPRPGLSQAWTKTEFITSVEWRCWASDPLKTTTSLQHKRYFCVQNVHDI